MKPIRFKYNNRWRQVNYLLSTNVVKTSKGEKLGYLTGVLYIDTAVNPKVICPSHTADCLASCLKTSGQLGMKFGASAIKNRALFFMNYREEFIARLKLEIAALVARAERKGLIPAIRLNGSSDIPWEHPKYGAIIPWVRETFPAVRVYDYTKIVGRALPSYSERFPGYSVTFSWSGENAAQCASLLAQGVNVAVPFDIKRGGDLPSTFLNYRVIDGDKHDLRFLDEKGVVVGLRYKHSYDGPNKGRKLQKRLGFIVEANNVG